MTEQEAIEVIRHLNICGICTTGYCGECERKQVKDMAITALEEVRQYRAMEQRLKSIYGDCDGLLEKVVEHLESHEDITLQEPIFKARLLTDEDVDRWEKYKAACEWIPCSECLPEEPVPKRHNGFVDKDSFPEYIVMIECDEIPTVLQYMGGGEWYRDETYYSVIAWMPLPQGYKREMT